MVPRLIKYPDWSSDVQSTNVRMCRSIYFLFRCINVQIAVLIVECDKWILITYTDYPIHEYYSQGP